MIKAFCTPDGKPTFAASINGIAIYLDNWAIKALAKGDSALRERFVAAFTEGGADLMFSTGHAVEIIGPQGASSSAFKTFLNQLGDHWYPVELKVFEVAEREAKGLPASTCCLDEEVLTAFFQSATGDHSRGSGKVIDLSEGFFKLGPFIDWLSPRREEFRAMCEKFDEMMKESIGRLRARHKKEPGWLDKALPQQPFHPSRAAGFACVSLTRELVSDRGFQVRKGDGIDFCHAVMASAFATFATLDKQWKDRVENFPKPHKLPRVYYEPELGTMMDDIEAALTQVKSVRKSPLAL
jgi:hypothetical protein